ncbi:thymidine kinase [Desulfopila sp. IMCC35008]|uniref:thymidine kinase n=1 Tax=Desulfopila sp. IMCC35008 TaxID=2653858 RepID=UPI0013D4A7BB|nr:thymidine kinase [Desulfopila sp. IMCC35008]
MAKLYFRYGAMNSGKTTALIQVAHNYRERGMETILVKPVIDSKGQDRIVSRLDIEKNVDIVANSSDNLSTILTREKEKREKLHCILVDEAQFLTSEQVTQLFEFAVLVDIPVICYGLRTDFLLNGFEGSKQLLLLAHSIEELKTICQCGRKALANARKINGQFVFSGDQVAIDGEASVEYEPLCAQCYYKHRNS